MNKKNLNFEEKWPKSQTKAQKRSQDDFMWEILWRVRESGRSLPKPGDFRIIWESWRICTECYLSATWHYNSTLFTTMITKNNLQQTFIGKKEENPSWTWYTAVKLAHFFFFFELVKGRRVGKALALYGKKRKLNHVIMTSMKLIP